MTIIAEFHNPLAVGPQATMTAIMAKIGQLVVMF